jgi:DNA polymerase
MTRSSQNRPETEPEITSLSDALDDIRSHLLLLAGFGWRGFDCCPESLEVLSGWGRKPQPETETLEAIRRDLGDCDRCRLATGRNAIVFGAGHPHAELVFVGEGPGFEEDRQGLPFVGAAGRLLTKIIQAINLTREEVYICNIIKCRPPDNRNPLPDEIAVCTPFLERQIKAVQPLFICALGTFAAQTLLGASLPISKLRGHFYDYMGIRLLPTYHPAYLLRNPEKKREVWEDMKKLMHAMQEHRRLLPKP